MGYTEFGLSVVSMSRFLFGGILLWAAAGKLIDPESFVRLAGAHRWVPRLLARIAGRTLPGAELVLGFLLVADLIPALAALAAGSLVLAITAVGAVTILRGETLPCGCFGRLNAEPLGWHTVARGVLLTAGLLLTAYELLRQRPSTSPESVAVGAGVLVVTLLLSHALYIRQLGGQASPPAMGRGEFAP